MSASPAREPEPPFARFLETVPLWLRSATDAEVAALLRLVREEIERRQLSE